MPRLRAFFVAALTLAIAPSVLAPAALAQTKVRAGQPQAGTFLLTQQAGRHWMARQRPRCVVNIASTHGLVGAAERSTYGISKAAIIHMTKMLAIEWAEHGIRVNAIAPGRMDTASPSRAEKGADAAYMAAMLARVPLHRLATAEEVAAAV